MDDNMKTTVAKALDYPEKLNYCNSKIVVTSRKSKLKIAGEQLLKEKTYGFDELINPCFLCSQMDDGHQRDLSGSLSNCIHYPGLSMGAPSKVPDLMYQSPAHKIINRYWRK